MVHFDFDVLLILNLKEYGLVFSVARRHDDESNVIKSQASLK